MVDCLRLKKILYINIHGGRPAMMMAQYAPVRRLYIPDRAYAMADLGGRHEKCSRS